MTDTFASPADAADTIAEQAAQLRLEAHRDAHVAAEFGGTTNIGAEMEHLLKANRDDALVECLSYVLGSDEAAADTYIARWAAANGADLDMAAIRVKDMPTANQINRQRAEAKVLDALREAGTAGLSKKELLPLLAQLGWREEERWIMNALREGTVVEQRQGRGTHYVYNAPIAPLPVNSAEAPIRR
ncbi:hypothetical protein [Kitasatospora sp. NPDC057223]|uniref:hypothetical protein n=1 Tax=Kitasatospora sp. NPDC057223 TaxID=3346055 RepID=UPI003628EB0F